MSLSDFATAMQGLANGVNKERSAMRGRQVEDQSFRRQTMENDQYEAMSPLKIQQEADRTRITNSQANLATETEEGKIESTNLANSDVITKYKSRRDKGVPEKEVMAQMTDAERKVVEDHLASERANELMAQGVPEKEARARAASNDASTSKSNRSINKDAYDAKIGLDARKSDADKTSANRSISDNVRKMQANKVAAKMGLDRTVMWAESQTASANATKARRAKEDIELDEHNGRYELESAARVEAAKAANVMAEIQTKLATARRESNFDINEFTKQNIAGIAQGINSAAKMAAIGGDAAAAALPLINMDQDDDGELDFPGAVTTGIRNINGEDFLVALDEAGGVVPSSAAPGEPGMRLEDIEQLYSTTSKDATKTSTSKSSTSKTTPVKLSEVDDLNDLSYDLIGRSFGFELDDVDGDGTPDEGQFTAEGRVPDDFVAKADQAMPAIQTGVSAYLAAVQRNGGSVAEAQRLVSSPAAIVKNVYGANDTDLQKAQSMARENAAVKAVEQGVLKSKEDEPPANMIEQEYNKLLVTLMSQATPQIP